MKKIVLFVLCLVPLMLFGQTYNVRHVVSPDGEVTFWRGQQQLFVRTYTGEPIYVADHYVAANGDDDNTGTFTDPWATWQKAFDNTVAGERTYIRGGIYYQSDPTSDMAVNIGTTDGSAGNLIEIFAYPGEVPILNCSNSTHTANANYGINMQECDYWHLKGLQVTGVLGNDGYESMGFRSELCDNITLENMTISNTIYGTGFYIMYGSNFLIQNCDSYGNSDTYNTTDGNGFAMVYGHDSLTTSTFRGCRAWNNTWGEGFGIWDYEGIVNIDSCWAWNNTGTAGDGAGFELGLIYHPQPANFARRVVTNCIAANNSGIGFNQASAPCLMTWYNNVAYQNDVCGYYIPSYAFVDILRNNLAYLNDVNTYLDDPFEDVDIYDHNSWQDELVVSAADFVSLDLGQLDNSRFANGNLPVITTFNLVTGSDLKNAGVDVGIVYMGVAPDIGVFEFVE